MAERINNWQEIVLPPGWSEVSVPQKDGKVHFDGKVREFILGGEKNYGECKNRIRVFWNSRKDEKRGWGIYQMKNGKVASKMIVRAKRIAQKGRDPEEFPTEELLDTIDRFEIFD